MSPHHRCGCARTSEELVDAAQSGAQLDLGCTAVEPNVECPGQCSGYPKALRQTGSVEPVALGDENTKAVASLMIV